MLIWPGGPCSSLARAGSARRSWFLVFKNKDIVACSLAVSARLSQAGSPSSCDLSPSPVTLSMQSWTVSRKSSGPKSNL
eukprot:8604321-Pyramimonas_sp.AAC.1